MTTEQTPGCRYAVLVVCSGYCLLTQDIREQVTRCEQEKVAD